jgi:hypothetical protein
LLTYKQDEIKDEHGQNPVKPFLDRMNRINRMKGQDLAVNPV